MIAIGADYGGPELKDTLLCRAIQRVSVTIKGLREPSATILLNPIFCVPGSVSGDLPFEGIQYGKFDKKKPCLATLVAVPAKRINERELVPYLLNELHGCNAMVFEFYRQKGLVFPLRDAESLLAMVAESLEGRSNEPTA
ncbi:hypothetical protein [Methyloversatilis discipulorum]|uniref:hypothetical protein n=1 Tax=Methyloversatilis discipulorum TaxID=1119528 RepID=UPI0012F97BC6|nr:hypothetical protein [Methyloversatilis discipulorum]